ncbi:MAG: hypothetical protein DCF22_00490 [Leptolyngbya sp.]|nr:MAG: hypothetical protein DCF22_00490 [Leptolyngbya sp.]
MPDETPLILTSSLLTILNPDGKSVELVCPARASLKVLRSHFVELQSIWTGCGFSTADLVMDDRAWALMGEIAKLFPRKDNPAVTGFDLEPLQTDLAQIEQLFLTGDRAEISAYRSEEGWIVFNLMIDVFVPCKILAFCHFEARLVLQDAHAVWKARRDEAEAVADEKTIEATPPAEAEKGKRKVS